MRQLSWMAEPRREWLKFVTEVIAASAGVKIGGVGGTRDDTLPYSPAILEGLANS